MYTNSTPVVLCIYMHMNFSEHTEGGLPRALKRLFFTFPFYQRCRRRSNIPLFSHQSALPTRKESIPPRERQPNIACFIFWLGSLIPLIATKFHLQYLPHLVLLPVQRRFRTSGTTLPTESRCAKFTSYSLRNYTQAGVSYRTYRMHTAIQLYNNQPTGFSFETIMMAATK